MGFREGCCRLGRRDLKGRGGEVFELDNTRMNGARAYLGGVNIQHSTSRLGGHSSEWRAF